MKMTDIWDEMFGKEFQNIFGNMGDLRKMVADMMKNIGDPNVQTYGYTMYKGPDGVPHVHEFGNAANAAIPTGDVREPLTDVCQDGNVVRITVELPGVTKEDIHLEGTDSSMTVSVDTDARKFKKTIAMPCTVNPNSAKAEYNNGMLEVTVDSKEKTQKPKNIKIN